MNVSRQNTLKNSAGVRITVLALVTLILGGCVAPRPDLKRLYELQSGAVARNPVILIHGFYGARLRDRATHDPAWPPQLGDILQYRTHELALSIDEKTLATRPSRFEAYAIFDELAGYDFYGRLLYMLEKPGGYIQTEPGAPVAPGDRRFYVFHYDWRQDIVQTARELDRFIDRLRKDWGQPDLRFDIVAHSMGGLVARYYARYGTEDVLGEDTAQPNWHGARRFERVVLMGTPNFGSVSAVYTYIQGVAIGAVGLPVEILTTWPAVYQLFPHPLAPWLRDIDGALVSENLYDPATWQRYGWGPYDPEVAQRYRDRYADPATAEARLRLLQRFFVHQLGRAERLAWALSNRAEQEPLNYILFGGDCELTPAMMVVEPVRNKMRLRMWPEHITDPRSGTDYSRLMLQPGDGRVTKASLFGRETLDPTVPRHHGNYLSVDYSISFCEAHDKLTGNVHFQDNLLNILLTPD
jgi:pimeloyl-ACP methyl ester carboxylesterase